MKFLITHNKINMEIPSEKTSGGLVTFLGLVRNHNEGKKVTSLEYSCYEEMAAKEGERIVNEAIKLFGVKDAYCIHRMGHLDVGDVAVYAYAHSPHRKEAFEASAYIIDKVKSLVPIWKREHYVDSDPVWVACHRCQG